jgi:hypothetical protein
LAPDLLLGFSKTYESHWQNLRKSFGAIFFVSRTKIGFDVGALCGDGHAPFGCLKIFLPFSPKKTGKNFLIQSNRFLSVRTMKI